MDDFGDLYLDVVIQASSVINSLPNSSNLCTESEPQQGSEGSGHNKLNQSEKKENLVSESKELNEEKLGVLEEVDDESDSEDDLNIVLNDEDRKGFEAGRERNGNGNGGDGYEDEEGEEGCGGGFVGAKNGVECDVSGNGVKGAYHLPHLQYKNVRPYGSSFTSNKKGNESAGTASRSFSSATGNWEDNRCKQHEVNSGQVANFRATANSVLSHGGYGFSLPWYRSILDVNIDTFKEKRWRYPGVDMSDFFNFGFNEDSWKQYCMSLEQSGQQSYTHGAMTILHCSKPTQRKGRAIQVEDSTGERQPTMDLMRPCAWDSDVVIRINVQDSNDNSSQSGAEQSSHIDSIEPGESKKRRDFNGEDIGDACSSGSASRDEPSAESLKGNLRCFQSKPVSNKMSLNTDNNEANQISNAENAHSSEGIAEIGRKECKSDQFLSEPELSLSDYSYFSPSLSYSDSDSEASRDSICHTLKDSPGPLRRPSSGTKLQESVTSNPKSPERNGVIRTPGVQRCSSHKRSVWEERKDHNQRLRRVPEWRIHRNNDSYTFPAFRDRSSLDCSRQIENVHDFDHQMGEDFSHSRQKDPSCGYNGRRCRDDHAQAVYKKHCHRKYHHSFKDEVIPQNRRDWDEKEFFHERRCRLDDQDTCNDLYSSGRGPFPEDMIPPTYWRSRHLVSKYNYHREREILWRRKIGNIQFQKSTHSMRLLGHENEDDLMQENCGRSVPLANQKRFSFNENGERHDFIGREWNPSSRRDRYGCDSRMDLNSSWNMEIEDDDQRETYESNDGRWQEMLPSRSVLFNSRLTERYRRPRRRICIREGQDRGWDGNCNDTVDADDGIIYPDDQVHLERRKYSRRFRVLKYKQDESILRHHVGEFYDERKPCSYGVTSTHEIIHAKHRSPTGGVVNGMDFSRHSYKMIRERSDAKCVNRNPGRMYRSGHEKMVRRCCDPVDLNVVEVKKSMFKRMDLKFAKEPECSNGFNESQTGNATQTDVLETGGNDREKWIGKFQVTEHNEKLNIEDSQIMAEESSMESKLAKKCAFKSAVPTCNAKERNFLCENASSRDKNGGAFDSKRILDTIAKMEKRRERFKDPIAQKKELDKTSEPQVDVVVDTFPANHDRPARKRRWGGT